ncbi:SDR family NAD(P)-dependent oxidoreductase [Novosphingobium pentaromativorans]|nr:SDR family oxidoreductase [Novosphingobium pentaromativorans]AIT80557.1 hypothetical protein JI59_12625 [Novosphingobium pentaromativorans US6-1]
MKRLAGKAIAIIGAGGIGDALAQRFVSEGADVLLGDRDSAAARAGAQRAGSNCSAMSVNAADEDSVAAFFGWAREMWGGLDGAHLNFADFSAAHPDQDLLTLSVDAFDRQGDTNIRGTFLCARAAVPLLLDRGGGTMLITGSGAAAKPDKSGFGYGMSKAAGNVLMRHIAYRYGAQGVRANVIQCGMVLHERLLANARPDFAERALAGQVCKTRVTRPEDVAAMSAMLMSDEGATISGQVIAIDGGSTMRL